MRAPLTTIAAVVLAGCALAPQAGAATASTERVSLTAAGGEANDYSALPVVSENGRWVAFDSYATNIVDGPQVTRDTYVRDTQTGKVTRLLKGLDGAIANAGAAGPSISADGRLVAVSSDSTNLAPNTTHSGADVFLVDRATGKIARLSTSLTGGDGDGVSLLPQVSADGTHVVFQSSANDLVAGDTANTDIFDYDVAKKKLRRVSEAPDGTQADGNSAAASVSDGGRFVAFTSVAKNLVTGDNNGVQDDFVRDMTTGAVTRVSVSATGGESNGFSSYPSITADGCLIAFYSDATNLVAGGDSPAGGKAYVRDRCRANTEVASLTNAGANANARFRPVPISDDGCVVAFVSTNATSPALSVYGAFTRDRCAGVTSRVDVATGGEGGNGSIDYLRLSSGSGRYAAFDSGATNLVAGDANMTFDAFVHDDGQAAPPTAALKLSGSGLRVVADASGSTDADDGVASIAISFGDGSASETAVQATHDYANPGTYTVTATVTDRDGLTASASKPVTVTRPGTGGGPGGGQTTSTPATTPPPLSTTPVVIPGFGDGGVPSTSTPGGGDAGASLRLSAASLTKRSFRPVRRGTASTLRLSSSRAASLTLSFRRAVRGRSAKGRCSSSARRGKRCTLYRAAGSLRVSLKAGANRVSLSGRVAGHALKPGRYRLTALATDDDGNRSNSLSLTLTIKR